MSEEHDDLVERLEDVSPIPDAMSQVPVKWVHSARLQNEKRQILDVRVIEMSALRDWLREVNAKSIIPCAIAPELAVTACYEINQMTQRLLALLGEVKS